MGTQEAHRNYNYEIGIKKYSNTIDQKISNFMMIADNNKNILIYEWKVINY